MPPEAQESALPVESGRGRGEGAAMARAAFRDPADFARRVGGLQLEVARDLVNVPALPIDLPAFDLTLLSVSAERTTIGLVLGKSEPIARLSLRRIANGSDAAVPGDGEAKRSPVVAAEVVELHPVARRYRRQLAAMAKRLAASITTEKWEMARGPADRLAELPVGVPIAFYRQLVPGVDGQALVRVGFKCNQNCGICWQDRGWGRFDATQVLTWIEDLYAAGARSLIISGGEPTLDASLDRYVARARGLGFAAITLETNAIQFARPGLAQRLRDSGLTDCFVSLHSGDAVTSDAITRAPGTFSRTVAGIKALLAAGVPVRLNCVLTREGIGHVEGLPDFIASEFSDRTNLQGLMLSQPSDPFDPSLLPSIIPEPARLRAVLSKVIDRAFELGVPVSGLDGPCGPPLCAFAADPRITDLSPIGELLSGRTYLPACDGCAVRAACYGPRIADVDLYGESCVEPLAEAPRAGLGLRSSLTGFYRSAKERLGMGPH